MAEGRGSKIAGSNLFKAYEKVLEDIGSEQISLLIMTNRGGDFFDSLLMAARSFVLKKDMVSYHALLDEYRSR